MDAPGAEPAAAGDGRRRVVVYAIRPHVDGGRYAVKRVLGDTLVVEVDLLVDGHDRLDGVLLFRQSGETTWRETPLSPEGSEGRASTSTAASRLANDGWHAAFVLDDLGTWEFTVSAWVDTWATWVWGLRRKLEANQDVGVDLRVGAALLAEAAARAPTEPRAALLRAASGLHDGAKMASSSPEAPPPAAGASDADPGARAQLALSPEVAALMRAHADRSKATVLDPPLRVTVDPVAAAFSSWYEMFPRSCGPEGQHGTLRDAEQRLPYIADMGFNVVYLPPIHPIGLTHRKGRDNRLTAASDDPGSPWAIGAREGGHLDVNPRLGTVADLRHFLEAARGHGLAVALDIALQASPDHPYVQQHPEWFTHRPDGSIQYAENPPKAYQDILPFDFGGAAWESLWTEARGIFLFWIDQGVRFFRVDNPHTKPLPFWEWCIGTIKNRHPEVVFLAEAFTRPKLMYALAKLGFSQSYTYFTWRTTKAELTDYVRSLVDSDVGEFFRPNFWPNTPDILPEHLQFGTRATFVTRAVLAATLSPSWGVYGPAYELQEKVARAGSEEYAHNEKYQLRSWDLDHPDSLRPVLRRLNHIRRDHPALQRLAGTVFHETDNAALMCYSRVGMGDEAASPILVVVNLDPHHRQDGWISLDLKALGLAPEARFQVHDLIGDARYLWQGPRAFVSLDPQVMPAHIFRLRRHVHTEQSFEYYL